MYTLFSENGRVPWRRLLGRMRVVHLHSPSGALFLVTGGASHLGTAKWWKIRCSKSSNVLITVLNNFWNAFLRVLYLNKLSFAVLRLAIYLLHAVMDKCRQLLFYLKL